MKLDEFLNNPKPGTYEIKAKADPWFEIPPYRACWKCWFLHNWDYKLWAPEASFPFEHRKCLRCNFSQIMTFPWGWQPRFPEKASAR